MNKSILVINYETPGINPRLCQNSRDSMLAACSRWGANLVTVGHNELPLTMAPAAMKTELFNLIPGEQVLVLDSDIVISEETPSPWDTFPDSCMTVVQNAFPTHGQFQQVKFLECEEWSKVCSVFGEVEYLSHKYYNTGFMLVRKDLHAQVFSMAKEIHLELSKRGIGLGWCDQTCINYASAKLGIDMCYAADTWNHLTLFDSYPQYLDMSKYIYHFAGNPARNEIMPKVRWRKSV